MNFDIDDKVLAIVDIPLFKNGVKTGRVIPKGTSGIVDSLDRNRTYENEKSVNVLFSLDEYGDVEVGIYAPTAQEYIKKI